MRRVDRAAAGWHLGRAGSLPRVQLWVPYDRTTGVYGPQGSGKTLDLLTPALLNAPGAALVTLTKPDDLFLTIDRRAENDRPVAVLDPFDLAPGVPELVWDPVAGCRDPMLAERRAKAFTAGTVRGAVNRGAGDDAARFYAAEGAKVLQAYLHAAALAEASVEDVLGWLADPHNAVQPEEVLRTHSDAAPFWDGLLRGALHGDDRTAGNTITTVQQSMALFFQQSIRLRCTPSHGRPATDLADLIRRRGTLYLLGRDDPYASASPLMTAVAEHALDTALTLAMTSPHGRLCPPLLACLDELPSTTPLPTLRTRMANERALGLSFIYAAQTWRQLVICYGETKPAPCSALPTTSSSSAAAKTSRSTRSSPTSSAPPASPAAATHARAAPGGAAPTERTSPSSDPRSCGSCQTVRRSSSPRPPAPWSRGSDAASTDGQARRCSTDRAEHGNVAGTRRGPRDESAKRTTCSCVPRPVTGPGRHARRTTSGRHATARVTR